MAAPTRLVLSVTVKESDTMKTVCFDIEGTTPDPATSRIIQIAATVLESGDKLEMLIDPECEIPIDSIEVHGITNDDVDGKPTFYQAADVVFDFFERSDALLGFNLSNYDVPLLWEEFFRAGHHWDLDDCYILDACTLFKKRESRTLEAAVEFYLGRKPTKAHDAMGDTVDTVDVWRAQLQTYGLDQSDLEALEAESSYDEKRIDLAGKIVEGPDGRPVYNIGKAKGTAVVDDPGFGYWMLDKDFTENTKHVLRKILASKSGETQSEIPF